MLVDINEHGPRSSGFHPPISKSLYWKCMRVPFKFVVKALISDGSIWTRTSRLARDNPIYGPGAGVVSTASARKINSIVDPGQ